MTNHITEIKDLEPQLQIEMTQRMDAIANKCIAELEEIAKLYGLEVKVDILLTDIKT